MRGFADRNPISVEDSTWHSSEHTGGEGGGEFCNVAEDAVVMPSEDGAECSRERMSFIGKSDDKERSEGSRACKEDLKIESELIAETVSAAVCKRCTVPQNFVLGFVERSGSLCLRSCTPEPVVILSRKDCDNSNVGSGRVRFIGFLGGGEGTTRR